MDWRENFRDFVPEDFGFLESMTPPLSRPPVELGATGDDEGKAGPLVDGSGNRVVTRRGPGKFVVHGLGSLGSGADGGAVAPESNASPEVDSEALFKGLAEEETLWLNACALRLNFSRYQSEENGEELFGTVDRILNGGELSESTLVNFAVLYWLRFRYMCLRGLRSTQISKDRIASRRLFLHLCSIGVPEGYGNSECENRWSHLYLPKLEQGRVFVDGRLQESEAATIGAIREILVDGDVSRMPAIGSDSALMIVASRFGDLLLMREGVDGANIQSILVDYYRKKGGSDIDTQYSAARRSARAVVFDIAAELVFGGKGTESTFDYEEAFIQTLIVTDPISASYLDDCVEYLFQGMKTGGGNFLLGLASKFNNARRRRVLLTADYHLLVLARHWVDPLCPLWLMTEGCVLSAARTLAPNLDWSQPRIHERLRLGLLSRCRNQPLRNVVVINELGDPVGASTCGTLSPRIKKFEVLKAIFPGLEKVDQCEAEIVPVRQARRTRKTSGFYKGQRFEPAGHG